MTALAVTPGGVIRNLSRTAEVLQVLLNPLSWADRINDVLVIQFGITLKDILIFMVLSFFFWKVLVLYVLPGIYFRVMLYTDEMDSHRLQEYDPYHHHHGHRKSDLEGGAQEWRLVQILEEAAENSLAR